MSSAEYVNVKMVDALSAVASVVDHQTVAVLFQTFLFSDLSGDHQQMAEQLKQAALRIAQANRMTMALLSHGTV